MSQNRQCKIIVDVMGGDFVPHNPILGASYALEEIPDLDIYLVGKKQQIESYISQNNISISTNNIIDATEVIEMKETPTVALRTKKQSSIVIGANLVKEGKADAFVSAGNTGAMMAASTLIIGRIKGFGRPTIGAQFPTKKFNVCTVYDVGASVDSKAIHLLEYAIMGTIYAKEIDGIKNPKVGLLSVGEEDSKGNSVSLEAFKLLKDSKVNFIGNVEGRDILSGEVDVVICDGFVGNIVLKFGESFVKFLGSRIRSYADKGILNKIKALITKSAVKASLKDMDYQSHGGVPLLGVNGISIIGHGSSSPLAMKNMILKASEMYNKNLIIKLKEGRELYGSL